MVGGGQVRSDASSVASFSSKFTSEISGLSGSWQGSSYDNLNSQAQSVAAECLNIIKSEMEAFASACDAYVEYQNYKSQLSVAQSNYNSAVSRNDTASANSFSSQISSYQSKLDTLKKQIEADLASAASGKIEAKAIGATAADSSTPASVLSATGAIRSAMDWAIAIAADDTHGYSQKTRWGNPNYDCSSLVISAWQAAGVNVKDAGAGYTGNMKSAFTKVGFKWIPGNVNVNDLQPGDVLLKPNSHTEMYIGDGMTVGAHGDKDGRNGDSGGGEISVAKVHNFGWEGVLRYVGYDQTKDENKDETTKS